MKRKETKILNFWMISRTDPVIPCRKPSTWRPRWRRPPPSPARPLPTPPATARVAAINPRIAERDTYRRPGWCNETPAEREDHISLHTSSLFHQTSHLSHECSLQHCVPLTQNRSLIYCLAEIAEIAEMPLADVLNYTLANNSFRAICAFCESYRLLATLVIAPSRMLSTLKLTSNPRRLSRSLR